MEENVKSLLAVAGIILASIQVAHAREWYLPLRLEDVCVDSRTLMNGTPPTPLDLKKVLIAAGLFDKTVINRDKSGRILVVEVWYIKHGGKFVVPYFADLATCKKKLKDVIRKEGTPSELR